MKVKISIYTTDDDAKDKRYSEDPSYLPEGFLYAEYFYEDKNYTLNTFKEIAPKIDKILREKQ